MFAEICSFRSLFLEFELCGLLGLIRNGRERGKEEEDQGEGGQGGRGSEREGKEEMEGERKEGKGEGRENLYVIGSLRY